MIRLLLLTLALTITPVVARAGPLADAPALGVRGDRPVGVRETAVTLAGTPARTLAMILWYPAVSGAQRTEYRYPTPPVPTVAPGRVPAVTVVPGAAARDAPAQTGRFPVVVLSHGFLNHAAMWSELAEALASKGYVVVAADHNDFAQPDFRAAFAEVVRTRERDQRGIIAAITRLAATADPIWRNADPARIALVGYSMGGFGALATAGAGYDRTGALYAALPPAARARFETAPAAAPPGLRALVTFAPWGGGEPLRAFSATELAKVRLPMLMIAGDHDDVADYPGGIRWLFDQLRGERFLLTYEQARHNVALNGTPAVLAEVFEYRERQDEPVWRKDRMLAINLHMLTAFLDWQLRGDTPKRRYLAVPTPRAADGVWPLNPGENVGAAVEGGARYWPGFQRRWALGLTMEQRAQGR